MQPLQTSAQSSSETHQRAGTSSAVYEPQQSNPGVSMWTAYAGLVGVHFMLRVRGYKSLRRYLARCTPRVDRAKRPIDPAALVDIVDWALVYYPIPVKCLHRSILITWLLKRRGVPANLVIGVQHTPFYAHAWVEVDGEVINDRASVSEQYLEMERV